jgi:hypothetical protein
MVTVLKRPSAFVCIAASVLLTVFVTGCQNDTDPQGSIVAQDAKSTVKINGHGQRVIMTTWAEQGVDARVMQGYYLDDGTKFFDHVVQLYGFRTSEFDCTVRTDNNCNRSGLHLCSSPWGGDNLIYNRIHTRYKETVQPVRDAGLKWIVNFCPASVPIGIFYRWPMGDPSVNPNGAYKWETIVGGEYPFNKAAVDKLLDQLKEIYDECPFDGLAFDEEYGTGFAEGMIGGSLTRLSGYPEAQVYPGISAGVAWRIIGENLLRFMHETNVKIFGPDYDKYDQTKQDRIQDWIIYDEDTGDEIPGAGRKYSFTEEDKKAMEQSKHRLIWEAYLLRGASYIPESYTYPTDTADPSYNGDFAGLTIYRKDLLDSTYISSYGGTGGSPWESEGWPRSRHGYTSCDVGFDQITPKPPIKESAGSGIMPIMRDVYRYNYGVVMFYCLRSRASQRKDRPANYFGPNFTPADDYLSDISMILFDGQRVRYNGLDDY